MILDRRAAVKDTVEVEIEPAASATGRRFLDFALRQGAKLLKMEVKYNLPQNGAGLARLAAQVEESTAAGEGGTTLVWSYRAPSQAAVKAVQGALGSNYSNVVFKAGIGDLLIYLRTFF